jgi:hypothetical protein
MFVCLALSLLVAGAAALEQPPLANAEALAVESALGQKLVAAMARAPVFALGANSTAAAEFMVHESLFKKVFAAVVPLICEFARKLTIPKISKKHFDVEKIHISEFAIGSIGVDFVAPNVISVLLSDFSMAIPHTGFELKDHILSETRPEATIADATVKAKDGFNLHCHGELWASVAHTSFTVRATVGEAGGRLTIPSASAKVHWGKLNIGHKLNHGLCKLTSKLVDVFVNVNKIIEKLIKKKVGPVMSTAVKKALVDAATKIPFTLASAPVATSTSLAMTVDIVGHGAAPRTGFVSHFPARDVELTTAAASVNVLLGVAQRAGKFNHTFNVNPSKANTSIFRKLYPAGYEACPGCPLSLILKFTESPFVSFQGGSRAIQIGFDSAVLGIVAEGNGSSIPLFEVLLNATGLASNWTISGPKKNTIDFDIALPVLALAPYHASSKAFAIALVADAIKWLVDNVVVKVFNQDFNGYTLPPIKGIALTDVEMAFADNSLCLGMDATYQV